MTKYFRAFLAAAALLLALPVSAQLGDVANTGGTRVERPRATSTTSNRAERPRATSTRTNRNTQRPTSTRRDDRNNRGGGAYCPPGGRRNQPQRRTAPTGSWDRGNNAARSSGNRNRANDQNRWSTRSQPAQRAGVSTSILFGRRGQDVGTANKRAKQGTSYVPRRN